MTEKTTEGSPTTGSNHGTSIVPWSDLGLSSTFEDFFRPFDQLFQSLQPNGMTSTISGLGNYRQPFMDIQDRGNHFSVTAELPGFTKDEVEVKVNGNGIELKAEKTEEQGQKNNKHAYQRSTRSYYQYLSIPEQIRSDKIEGTMKNGVLQLKLPKRASKLKDGTHRVALN